MTASSLRLAFLAAIALGITFSLAACGKVEDMAGGPDGGGGDHRGDDDSGDGSDDAGDDSGDAGDDQTTTPSVLSVTPGDGAAGVMPDAEIVIVFSEPMDQPSVEAAWSSEDLPPVSFAWNAPSDTVTITPDEPLALAEGSNPSSVDPIAYTFAIQDTAIDRDGDPLAAPLEVEFTTKRRISVALAQVDALTRTLRSDGVALFSAMYMSAGDLFDNRQYKMLVTFTLPALADGAEVEEAVLAGFQSSTVSIPYLLGSLRAQHTAATALDLDAFQDPPLGGAGNFSTSPVIGARSLQVTAEVADDIANRAERSNHSQFRIEFPTATDSDENEDLARFTTASFALQVTYLVD